MVQGVTFDKQLMASEDFAHQVNYFYQGKMGVSKGCEISTNVDGSLVISDGYFSIYGRLLKNVGDTAVEVPSVPSGTLYSSLVFEVDLTKENTIDAFNQGQFKIVSNAATYPTLTQENLDDGGNIYQLEFARFENTVNGIVNLQDKRTILSMQMYAPDEEFRSHLAESSNKHITEIGANENGKYTRFDDGTQICINEIFVAGNGKAISTPVGALYRSEHIGWTYPASFLNPKVAVVVTYTNSSANKYIGFTGIGDTLSTEHELAGYLISPISTTTNSSPVIVAIGRWK